MLRDPKRAADRSSRSLKAAGMVTLFMLGLAISGLRPEILMAQSSPAQKTDAADSTEKSKTKETTADAAAPATVDSIAAYLPAQALFVVTLRPKMILNDPSIKPRAEEIKKLLAETGPQGTDVLRAAGVLPENIEAMAIGVSATRSDRRRDGEAMFAIRLAKPLDSAVIAQAADESSLALGGIVYELGHIGHVLAPDEFTVLIAEEKETVAGMLLDGRFQGDGSPWPRLDERLDSPALSFLVNAGVVGTEIRKEFDIKDSKYAPPSLKPVLQILSLMQMAGLGVRIDDDPQVVGYARFGNEGMANYAIEKLKVLITLSRDTIRQLKSQPEKLSMFDDATIQRLIPLAEQILESASVKAEAGVVHLRADIGETSPILAVLLPALAQAHKATQREQTKQDLKQIALAFHNYHGVHRFFPPAVIEENGVKRSWRVEILPFLDQKDLYEQYRKDEPWDSAHNKKILAQIPEIFRDPADDSDPNSTSYYLLTSEHAVTNAWQAGAGMRGDANPLAPRVGDTRPAADFITLFTDEPINVEEGEKGPGIRDITDGTSNTFMIVEASRDIPWTKPENIPVDPDKLAELKKELGGNHPGGFLAAFADGSVKFISDLLHPTIFKRMISPVDGQPLSLP